MVSERMISRRSAYIALWSYLRQLAMMARSDIAVHVVDMDLGGGDQSWDPVYYSRFTEIFPEPALRVAESMRRAAAFVEQEFVKKQSVQEFRPAVAFLTEAAEVPLHVAHLLDIWLRESAE
jgi:hypothetical protein